MNDPPTWTVHLLEIPPELHAQIFFHLPNLASAVSLRLACQQLNAVYQSHAKVVKLNLRSLLIEPFREYYEFLQHLKFPDDSIKYPPAGGWPTINPEHFAPYNKTDFAISVLKHMPYINNRWDRRSGSTNLGYKSDPIDFSSFDNQPENSIQHHMKHVDWLESYMEEKRLREGLGDEKITGIKHIVTIAMGHESGGICLVLDTFAGIVFEEEVRGDPRSRLSPRNYCDKRMERLRKMDEIFYHDETTWEFNSWDADQYPIPDHEHNHQQIEADGEPVPEDAGDWDDKFYWIAHLYHKFGWPGKDYRKEECLEAIDAFTQRWQDAEDELQE